MNRPRVFPSLMLIVLVVGSRLLPHVDNVTPMGAVALFSGATLATSRSAILVPLSALLLSDALLHLSYLAGWQEVPGLYPGQWVVYACCLVTVALGWRLRDRRTIPTVALASVASSSIFFVVTNFAVWADGRIYPRTVAGLLQSYEQALPFFRNGLLGDLLFTGCLFGGFALATMRSPHSQTDPPRKPPRAGRWELHQP